MVKRCVLVLTYDRNRDSLPEFIWLSLQLMIIISCYDCINSVRFQTHTGIFMKVFKAGMKVSLNVVSVTAIF